jgi:glycosyltransferase involved in cell wall biosynthesis
LNITVVCEGFDKSSLALQPWHRIYEVYKRLLKNHVVTIVTNKKSGASNLDEIDGLRIYRIGNLTTSPILNKKFLANILIKNSPDVIVWCGTPLSALYLSRLKSVKKPLIWDIDSDIHSLRSLSRISIGEFIHPHHNFLWQQLLTAMLPRIVIRTVSNSAIISEIIVSNNYLKKSLQNIGVKPAKIAIVPSTIDKADFISKHSLAESAIFKKTMGYRSEEVILAYFGSPCTLRGVDTAVLSMSKVIKKRKDVKLMIFSRRDFNAVSRGDKLLVSEEKKLKKLIRNLGVEDCVRIVPGVLSKQELKKHVYASDAIILPFKLVFSEPPLFVFEAMALGKTVITTRIGGLPEILENARGILVNPGNAEDLSNAIQFVASHRNESVLMEKNALEYVAALPTWDQVALRYEAIINLVIQGVAG